MPVSQEATETSREGKKRDNVPPIILYQKPD